MHEQLKQLEAEQIPPTRLTVDTLVRGGRRKQRRRRLTAAAAVVAVLPLGLAIDLPSRPGPEPAATGFPTSCVGKTLPVSDERGAGIHDADPQGRYIVGAIAIPFNTPMAIGHESSVTIWRDGSVTTVDPPGDGVFGRLAVNPDGVVAGSTQGPSGGLAWTYRDGRFTTLPGTGGELVVAINSRGDVIANTIGGSVVWRQGGARETLSLPTGARIAQAKDIDDDGTVVGFAYDDEVTTAVLWRGDGTIRQLPVPPGMNLSVTPVAVRNGHAIGVSGQRSDPSQTHDPRPGILWDLRTETATRLSGGLTRATDINRSGWLAGFTPQGQGAIADGPAGRALRLPPPVDAPTLSWIDSSSTVTISDDGKAVTADMADGADRFRAVRWTCS